MKQPETDRFGINSKNFLKSETWSILCRSHATFLTKY